MKGLELSELYFSEVGIPMIQEKFLAYKQNIAAGLVGDGSECFGFDNEISRDHDWGPSFRRVVHVCHRGIQKTGPQRFDE